MTHVLILVVAWKVSYAGTLVISSQEYSSLASCEKAGKAAQQMIVRIPEVRQTYFSCVPK